MNDTIKSIIVENLAYVSEALTHERSMMHMTESKLEGAKRRIAALETKEKDLKKALGDLDGTSEKRE